MKEIVEIVISAIHFLARRHRGSRCYTLLREGTDKNCKGILERNLQESS